MDKESAVQLIVDCLEAFKIRYFDPIPEAGDENNTDIYFVSTEMDNSPEGFIETTITFCEDCLLARAYYSVNGQKLVSANLERFPALFRLFNFINEEKNHIAIQKQSRFDGDERKAAIFSPQLRMTEDGEHSIKYQLIVDYSYFELFPNETAQMLLLFLQLYLNEFAISVFGVLTGKMSLKEAKKNIVSIAHKEMPFPSNYRTLIEEDDEYECI